MDLITPDDDSDLGEKATPAPRKKALKSNKIKTRIRLFFTKWSGHTRWYILLWASHGAEYEGLTILLFIRRYLVVMVAKNVCPSPHDPASPGFDE